MNILSDYINNDYKPLDIHESVAIAQDFFAETPFSHFPVMDEGVFIGNLSSEDVETFDFDKKILDYKYTLEGFFAKSNSIWLDVLEDFAKNQSTICLNILNALLGCLCNYPLHVPKLFHIRNDEKFE